MYIRFEIIFFTHLRNFQYDFVTFNLSRAFDARKQRYSNVPSRRYQQLKILCAFSPSEMNTSRTSKAHDLSRYLNSTFRICPFANCIPQTEGRARKSAQSPASAAFDDSPFVTAVESASPPARFSKLNFS